MNVVQHSWNNPFSAEMQDVWQTAWRGDDVVNTCYCNALFADCSDAVRQRLQRIQNSAARVIHSQPVFSWATPLLQNLHWLPIQKRVTYKLCVLIFDIVRGSAPSYLTDSCNICSDDRLRSASRGLFVQPWTNTKLANKAFSVAGPSAWNSLPSRIIR